MTTGRGRHAPGKPHRHLGRRDRVGAAPGVRATRSRPRAGASGARSKKRKLVAVRSAPRAPRPPSWRHRPVAHPVEQRPRLKPALADHLHKGLRVGAIGAFLDGSDRAGRGVECDEAARLGLRQSKATRQWYSATMNGERRAPSKNQKARLQREGGEALGVIRDPECAQGDIGCAAHAQIDRREVVLAFELQAHPAR